MIQYSSKCQCDIVVLQIIIFIIIMNNLKKLTRKKIIDKWCRMFTLSVSQGNSQIDSLFETENASGMNANQGIGTNCCITSSHYTTHTILVWFCEVCQVAWAFLLISCEDLICFASVKIYYTSIQNFGINIFFLRNVYFNSARIRYIC